MPEKVEFAVGEKALEGEMEERKDTDKDIEEVFD